MNYPDVCVIWPGRKDRDGYGGIHVAGHQRAHRLLYAMFVGAIPSGMCVLHRCDTPGCVNPAHLKLGTHQENMDDKRVKRRARRGVRAPLAKLTEEQVREIRRGLSVHEAWQRFGIHKSSYYDARKGRTYQDVSP